MDDIKLTIKKLNEAVEIVNRCGFGVIDKKQEERGKRNIIEKHIKQMEVELSKQISKEWMSHNYDWEYQDKALDRIYEILTEGMSEGQKKEVGRYVSATVVWDVGDAGILRVGLCFADKMICRCSVG